MFRFLLDLFFPKHSLLGEEGEWIMGSERKRMKLFPIRLDKQLLRKKDLKHLDCLIAAGSYEASPLLRKALRTFKYGRIPELGPELASKIVESLPGLLLLPEGAFHFRTSDTSALSIFPVLCPVPLHWTRKFQRGFNQAEILAEEISKQKQWPVHTLLKRTRATGHQAWRKKAERLTAVSDAFFCTAGDLPTCVLLVDDISSTGATLDACAKALKKAGVKYVVGLVVAYG